MLLFIIFNIIFKLNYGQMIAPQSLNSAGVKMTQSNGSISSTLGELVVLNHKDSKGNFLGNGFAAKSSLTASVIKEANKDLIDVKIFPNPSSELLNIEINNSKLNQIFVSIIDKEGREIHNSKYFITPNRIGINMGDYSVGSYFLLLKDVSNNLIGTYNIIKQ